MMSKRVALLLLVALCAAVVGCATRAPEPGATVIVPKVTTLSEADARAALTKAGLKVGVVTKAPYPADAPAVVITQDPAALSPATPGTAVDLVVAVPSGSGAGLQVPTGPLNGD